MFVSINFLIFINILKVTYYFRIKMPKDKLLCKNPLGFHKDPTESFEKKTWKKSGKSKVNMRPVSKNMIDKLPKYNFSKR